MALKPQQINLYQPIFRKQKVVFSFDEMVLILSVLFVAMAAISGFMQWQLSKLDDQLKGSEQQAVQLQQKIEELKEELKIPELNKMLELELQRTKEQQQAGYALLNTLQNQVEGNHEGFSEYFAGFARQTQPGLWFTRIEISQAGDSLTLQGKTLRPEWLPQLLKRLETEKAFDNRAFQVMELVRPAEFEPALDFKLSTAAKEDQSQ